MYTETMARRGAGSLAKLLALMCVENSKLEQHRLGLSPVIRTGDYSDVMVVDADGRHTPWQRVARLDTDEMRETMLDIVDKLYTCFVNFESPQFAALCDHRREDVSEWARPRLEPGLLKQMELLDNEPGPPG